MTLLQPVNIVKKCEELKKKLVIGFTNFSRSKAWIFFVCVSILSFYIVKNSPMLEKFVVRIVKILIPSIGCCCFDK